jgi:hypothetical protein
VFKQRDDWLVRDRGEKGELSLKMETAYIYPSVSCLSFLVASRYRTNEASRSVYDLSDPVVIQLTDGRLASESKFDHNNSMRRLAYNVGLQPSSSSKTRNLRRNG